MIASPHTPGPWRINPRAKMNVQSQSDTIACCGGDRSIGEEVARANARLIVASPILLDVVQRLVAYNAHYSVATHPPEWFGMIRDAKVALAKATESQS